MNDTIQLLMNHRSYRSYSDRAVAAETLELIVRAAQAAPSWVHGQQMSVVAVRDPERKRKLSEWSGNQRHVDQAPVFLVFCMDFYRASLAAEAEGAAFHAAADADLLLVGAADVGISIGNAVAAAESLGLGCIPIGGIRRNTEKVIGLLNLPKHVFPVAGLCLGYPGAETPVKPRLPLEAVLHEETYRTEEMQAHLQAYNAVHRHSLAEQGLEERDWTQTIARFYAMNPQYGDSARMLPRQGFTGSNLTHGTEGEDEESRD